MKEEILYYFSHITALQIIDIFLVSLFIFQLFRALRGSIAFNLFIGALVIYIVWAIVNKLNMPLLNEILDRLVSIGLIGLIVLFQPEIRKFLIVLGRRSPLGKNGFVSRMFQSNALNKYIVEEEVIEEITTALLHMQQKNIGAIIIIARSDKFEFDTNSGTMVNGSVSSKMIESIFQKDSPLHDGAILIDKDIIVAAGLVLPISDSHELPNSVGLRHRSAVGATEHNDVLVVVLSEETASFAMAYQGKLYTQVAIEEIKKEMYQAMIV